MGRTGRPSSHPRASGEGVEALRPESSQGLREGAYPPPQPSPAGGEGEIPAVWLGRKSYAAAHALQVELRDRIIAGDSFGALLLLEHEPVVTLGRRHESGDLLVGPEALARAGLDVVATERGGRATYHGPGQVVGYPVFRLRALAPDVPTFVWGIEEALIRTAGALGVAATRSPMGRGVWVGEAKLGCIGLAVTRGVCWHGFALNVRLEPDGFRWIRPCGLDVHPISISQVVGEAPTVEAVARLVGERFCEVFGRTED